MATTNSQGQYAIKEVMELVLCEYSSDPNTAKPIALIDYAQVTGLEHSSERILVKGGRGNKTLVGFDGTKEVMLNLTLPLADFKVLAYSSGDPLAEKVAVKLPKTEKLLVKNDGDGNCVILQNEPLNGTLFTNILLGDRTLGETIMETSRDNVAPDEKKCSIKIVDGKVKLYLNATTCPVDSEVSITYSYEAKREVSMYQHSSDKFPKYVTLKGTALLRNADTGEDCEYAFTAYKCHIQDNFSFNMSATDPTVLELQVNLYNHRDKQTGDNAYYELVEYDGDDTLGTISLTNVNVNDGIKIKMGTGEFAIGIQQENVIVTSDKSNDTHFTVMGNKITPVSEGTGNIVLKKVGYNDLTVPVTIEPAARSVDGRSTTSTSSTSKK